MGNLLSLLYTNMTAGMSIPPEIVGVAHTSICSRFEFVDCRGIDSYIEVPPGFVQHVETSEGEPLFNLSLNKLRGYFLKLYQETRSIKIIPIYNHRVRIGTERENYLPIFLN